MKHLKGLSNFLQYRLKLGIKILKRNFDDILLEIVNKCYPDTTSFVAFDVGAEAGISIGRIKKIFANKVVIYSFEPSKKVFKTLTSRWSHDKRVRAFNMGLGSTTEELVFHDHTTSASSSSFVPLNENSSFSKRRNFPVQTIESYPVSVVTLDDFCSQNQIERIHLLKIDVQGFEENVLQGTRGMLSRHKIDLIEVEIIVVDAYNKRTSFYDIEKNLQEDGYRMVALSNDGRYYNLAPFDVLKNPELYFDVLYASPEIYQKITDTHALNSAVALKS